MVFGYKNVDGKFVVNEEEAEIVRYIFDKHVEYTDNPPDVLIQEVIEEAEASGEILTDAEIKERAVLKVLPYLTNEVNKNWPTIHRSNEMLQGFCFQKHKSTELDCIVDSDTWTQVNDKLKNRMG